MRFLLLLPGTFIFCFSWMSDPVYAQVDASTQSLFRNIQSNHPESTGLASGRYQVRGQEKAKTPPRKKGRGASSESSPVLKEVEPSVLSVEAADLPAESKGVAVEPPPVTDQVKDLISGKDQPVVEAYKEQVHPDDIRLNRLEIHVLPGVVANNSKSNYSFRDYSSFSPHILLGADFWMTPFLGIYGNYMTSLGADIAGDGATRSRISAQHEWSEIGFQARRFFGLSRRANSLQFGFYISEYKMIVPGDNLQRLKLKSQGIGVQLMTRIPVAASYSWIFGGKIIPRIQHLESSTGIEASSGGSGGSSRVDLFVGGEFKLQRQDQIIWNLTLSSEKNQFSGPASLSDPSTGSTPTGVSVENNFTFFSLGYRWGQ